MTKAPLGWEETGPNPTDRAKSGAERSLQTEEAGIPIGLAIAPANRNDHKTLETTLENRPIRASEGTSQQMCLDKGYDYDGATRSARGERLRCPHPLSRGGAEGDGAEPQAAPSSVVVERTHSWMNRFGRLLVRWARKVPYYLALVQWGCAWTTYRAGGLFAPS